MTGQLPAEPPSESIEGYGVIGDGRAAALVSRAGSIDWLCWPRFDSPSLFGALLDEAHGGRFAIHPSSPFRATRRYLDDTNVLVTRFATADGAVELTDLLPIATETENAGQPAPEHALLRRLICQQGEMELDVLFEPRPGYGLKPVHLRNAGPLGLRLEVGAHLYLLVGGHQLAIVDGGRAATGRIHLRAGDSLAFWLILATEDPAVIPPAGDYAESEIDRTAGYWRSWLRQCRYDGPYRAAVRRSALALKLLHFPLSGAVVAATTTSLPERPGGDLNWDYRFCWLRDAALTVRAFLELGFLDEATAFVDWLMHTTRLTRPRLHVLYDVFGRPAMKERVLPQFSGYRDSRPVRVGNAAARQFQLDIYGEVVDAVAQLARFGYPLDRSIQRMLRDFGGYVRSHWQRPDSSLWEFRGPPHRYTHSSVLSWTALARLVELADRGMVERCPTHELREELVRIRREIEHRGWNERLSSYTQQLSGDSVDASSLLLGWYGFHDCRSARMKSTWCAIRNRLRAGPGLIYRYEQSRDAGEGAFGICSFWVIEYLARGGGSLDEARGWMDDVLPHANDLGLMAEELDPSTGAALGNVPQAFSHVGLINAALSIATRERDQRAARSEAHTGGMQ